MSLFTAMSFELPETSGGRMIIAADVGGTNSRLGVYAWQESSARPHLLKHETYTNARYENLYAIIEAFLKGVQGVPEGIAIAVAGPVQDGEISLTNISWKLSEKELRKRFNLRSVRLLNDIEATAYAVPLLCGDDLIVLNPGNRASAGNVAVITVGTGLGEAFANFDGNSPVVYATEGGHCDFAPANHLQMGLLSYLLKFYDHVSYERICSGTGIINIYSYLAESGLFTRPGHMDDALLQKDPAPAIFKGATEQKDPLCESVVNIFLSILAAEIGNLALKTIPRGGIYLGGGIPPRIVDLLKEQSFIEACQRKGRLSYVIKEIPLRLILDTRAPMLGAAYALQTLHR